MPDVDGLDTPAERLTERFSSLGMTVPLAEGLVSSYGEEMFEGEHDSVLAARLQDLTEVLALFATRVWDDRRPRKIAGCFLLAAGMFPHGVTSHRDIAKRFHESPEAISNSVEEWQRRLNLPKTPHQKSEEAVEAARLTHRTNQRKARPAIPRRAMRTL